MKSRIKKNHGSNIVLIAKETINNVIFKSLKNNGRGKSVQFRDKKSTISYPGFKCHRQIQVKTTDERNRCNCG